MRCSRKLLVLAVVSVTVMALCGSIVRAGEGESMKLIKVWPQKLFFRQGEPIKGTVEVSNPTANTIECTVRVILTNGLDSETGKQEKPLTVEAGKSAVAAFDWPGSAVERYGHAMKAEILRDGRVVLKGEEYFTTAENVWEVGLAGNHPVAFTAEHVSDIKGIEEAVERFRQKYTNTFEKFFWAPDDFGDMTPKQERWYSGQVRYHEQLDRFKHLCDYGNSIGVIPTTYGKSMGSGSRAQEIIRENPEMIYGFGGVMQYIPDTEELSRWDKASTPYWQSTAWAFYNMNDPATVQKGIDQIIGSTEQFGWGGVRFDGHFQARTGKQRVGDRMVDFSPEMADKQTAANQRMLKEQALKRFPEFVFGYNCAECRLDAIWVTRTREMVELCEGGGHIMDEYAKMNAGGAHPYRNWADFALMTARQAEQVKRLGGYLFPMVSGGLVGRYQTIFALAAGAHPNATPWSIEHSYNRFATRYASLLWHRDIRNLWNPNGLVIIKPSVMWENHVKIQTLDLNHQRLIIHLINPPAQETATESYALTQEVSRREKLRKEIVDAAGKEKKQPDFSILDALPPVKLHPDVQKDIAVKIINRGFGSEWKPSRALLFNTEECSHSAVPLDTTDPYFWQLTIPEVPFWSIVVIDMER